MQASPSFFEGEESIIEETGNREPEPVSWVSSAEDLLEAPGREPDDLAEDFGDEVSWYRQVQDKPEDGHADSACSWALPEGDSSACDSFVDAPKQSIYSKDSYVALYGKVLGMFSNIRAGLFDPDMKAVMRMKVIAQRLAQEDDHEPPDAPRTPGPAHGLQDDPVPEVAESEAGSLSSGSEAPDGELRVSGMLGARSPFELTCLHATHVIRDETTLTCGRFLSSNFVRTAEAGIAGANPGCCHQCNRSLESH